MRWPMAKINKNEGHHKFPIIMIGFHINTKQGDNENNVIVDANQE
jgi:hypothetical protein